MRARSASAPPTGLPRTTGWPRSSGVRSDQLLPHESEHRAGLACQAVGQGQDGGVNQLRNLWWVPALLVASASAFLLVQIGVPAALGQGATPGAVTVPAPDWMFVVHGMQDPYAGVLTTQREPASGMRYVGADVEVVNASDQPLSFADDSVVLRDDEGFSYRSGTVVGSEPALRGRIMPGGEQARGWVWFEVPEGATLTEILLVPAAPELRVGLDEVASIRVRRVPSRRRRTSPPRRRPPRSP